MSPHTKNLKTFYTVESVTLPTLQGTLAINLNFGFYKWSDAALTSYTNLRHTFPPFPLRNLHTFPALILVVPWGRSYPIDFCNSVPALNMFIIITVYSVSHNTCFLLSLTSNLSWSFSGLAGAIIPPPPPQKKDTNQISHQIYLQTSLY